MNIKIMKFGGTSLSDEKARKQAYSHIIEELKQAKVLVVVSAMGRYPSPYATDTLLSMGSSRLTKEEKARLVSMGEQLSALIVCSELLNMGIAAYALPFHKNGILTDYHYEYANVLSLSPRCIKQTLAHHDVAVASGFIAQAPCGDVTTLGRGGSDFSAVLFADMLGTKQVDIYTDVDGVYDIDPKLSPLAKRYDHLTYDEMLNMKVRVLHDRCVQYAKEKNIQIHLRGTFTKETGTIIA
ncbi:aspartate kinase [Merdibacter massiliensis]|uniref:aspartate kinase n=1 Tax=Merdibacter massiliensis TaxID=1871030 RepID=UPI00096A7102|nr:aspartate kinase [Merdibacter massiliensis]